MVDVWEATCMKTHQTGFQMSREDTLSAWFKDILPCLGHVQDIPN